MLEGILHLASSLFGGSKQSRTRKESVVITNDEEYRRYSAKAHALLKPYMILADVRVQHANTRQAQAQVRRAIVLYSAVVQYAPVDWAAYWHMGKAHQALKEPINACDAFAKAFSIQKDNADVAREYMFECLKLGRASEGVAAAEHAVGLKPQNAGLLANLALAYAVAGRIAEAAQAVEKSLALDPADRITSHVKRVIDEIRDGKRTQPKTLRDMETPLRKM